MSFEITQIAHISVHFKSFSPVKSTQDENVCFIKGNELKLSYFHSLFLREYQNYAKQSFSLSLLNIQSDLCA